MGLPKIPSNTYMGLARRNSSELDKEKKEVVFKNTVRIEEKANT